MSTLLVERTARKNVAHGVSRGGESERQGPERAQEMRSLNRAEGRAGCLPHSWLDAGATNSFNLSGVGRRVFGRSQVISQRIGAPVLLSPVKRITWPETRKGLEEPLILISRIRPASEAESLSSMSQRPAAAGAYHPL